jgi:diacylglycerol kinase
MLRMGFWDRPDRERMSTALTPAEPDLLGPNNRRRPRRRWRDKFRDAFRGMKRGVRGHSSFFVHFFFAALVLAAALALDCRLIEWCALLGCIGMVLTAELFNSAIETLFHGLDEETQARNYQCLDIAAGAVLLASITAAVIGVLIFVNRLAVLLHWGWGVDVK